MKKYYYRISYQEFKYGPFKSAVYHGTSVADARLYAYATLKAYDVSCIYRTTKAAAELHQTH